MPEKNPDGTGQQLRRNVVALTALSYDSWRDELTEYNRNQGAGGFEILTELERLGSLE